MKNIIGECLRLLCGACGASAARLRFYCGEECEGEPFFESDGRSRVDSGAELKLRESAAPAGGFGPWRMEGIGYGSEWKLVRRLEGMSLSLDLELNERVPSFLHRRLSAAEELLGLLDHLATNVEIPPLRADHGEGVSGGIRGFDPQIAGISGPVVRLREDIRKVARGEIHVLVCGESGTGKELVARNIHHLGPRSDGPFVAVNCMEMPGTLLQGELFGSARGAYTGADRDRAGLIEAAAGGTFFLDEIGELPGHLQAALLRVLEEREVRRLGEGSSRRVDVRFVCATNRDLKELVRNGRFREDLFFRIGAVRLEIPPLRDRREDIPVLAARFLREISARRGMPARSITAGALSALIGYTWPGNVRELRNEIDRAVTMNPGSKRIDSSMLGIPSGKKAVPPPGESGVEAGTMPEAVARLERKMIVGALRDFGGNRTRTAKALGITRQGLLKKLKRMNIDPDRPVT